MAHDPIGEPHYLQMRASRTLGACRLQRERTCKSTVVTLADTACGILWQRAIDFIPGLISRLVGASPGCHRISQVQRGALLCDPARTERHSGRSNCASADGRTGARYSSTPLRWSASTTIAVRVLPGRYAPQSHVSARGRLDGRSLMWLVRLQRAAANQRFCRREDCECRASREAPTTQRL